MIDQMISDAVTSMVQKSIMEELGPYILLGTITFIMLLSFKITDSVDSRIQRLQQKRNAR